MSDFDVVVKRTPRAELVDVEVSTGTLTAVFSTFDVIDHDGDYIRPGAMPRDGTNVVISSYGHTSWSGSLPLGWGTIRSTATEAIVDAHFIMENQSAAEAFRIVTELGKRGLQEWSYSLHEIESTKGKINGIPARIITRVGLVKEISPVLKGASIGTHVVVGAKAQPAPGPSLEADVAGIYRQWTAQGEADLAREVARARALIARKLS